MKKLIVAAVAAAVAGGAFAACMPGNPDPIETAWVYTWKFSGKTTTGVLVKGSTINSGNCRPDSVSTADCAVRVPSALKIQGYTYKCLPCCGGFTELADDGEAFYTTKPGKEKFAVTNAQKLFTEGLVVDFAHVIGKKANQAELKGTFTGATNDSNEKYTFAFAGLGSYDLKNTRISSISGNFAGIMEVPHDLKTVGCPEAWYWNCDATAYAGSDATVAYGSWSMKYNSSASKKFLKDGTLVKLPKNLN